MSQQVIELEHNYTQIENLCHQYHIRKIFLVCGNSMKNLEVGKYLLAMQDNAEINFVIFSDFEPNPSYDSVVKGVDLFREHGCDLILAVGGGSAMDVAKCIKLYAMLPNSTDYRMQPPVPNDILLWAIPTTAGSGSEATRFAVIYHEGEKLSITDDSLIPTIVFLDSRVLISLSEYQKKATLLDALCHSIESYWSVSSTKESRAYAKEAISLILTYYQAYLNGDENVVFYMLKAANLAGKAINITMTTAGHAMCYKLTTMYGLAHGHSAALCVDVIWDYMLKQDIFCADERGEAYLKTVFGELAQLFGGKTPEDGRIAFHNLLEGLHLEKPKTKKLSDYEMLANMVNVERLRNHPVVLNTEVIKKLYEEIVIYER